MASFSFNGAKEALAKGTLDMEDDTLMVLLVGTSYDGDADNIYVDDITTLDELDTSGYVGAHGGAGRKALNVTVTRDDANDQAEIDAVDIVWSSIGSPTSDTVNAALIYRVGTSDDTDALNIISLDLTNTPTNGGNITLQFNAEGFGKIT